MEKFLSDERFLRFLDTFKVCGTFLYEYKNEIVEYLIFERFDDHIIIDISETNLNIFVRNKYITEDLKNMCMEFREISLSVMKNEDYDYTASFAKHSYAWKHIFKFADLIRQELIRINSAYDLSPIIIKDRF